MKRWLSTLAIGCYLSALAFGIFSHSMYYKNTSHPAMYYIVWDMFCGWSAHDSRLHVIGEGESGKFYQLAPGPWGELEPFGDLGRRHYDTFLQFGHRYAQSTLAHTQHEPMRQIYMVEECWPKKFNMPEWLWNQRYDEPKDIKKYYHVYRVAAPDGTTLQSQPSWHTVQALASVSKNPRLQADVKRNQPFYALDPRNNSYRSIALEGVENRVGQSPEGSPLAN